MKLYPYLTLAGILPFLLGNILMSQNITEIAILGDIPTSFKSYTLIIAIFMAAVH